MIEERLRRTIEAVRARRARTADNEKVDTEEGGQRRVVRKTTEARLWVRERDEKSR